MTTLHKNKILKSLNDNPDFKGLWIPKDILLNEKLTSTEKICLSEIHALDNSEKHCTASNTFLSTVSGCSNNVITKMVSKFKQLNFISEINFDGRIRTLKSNFKKDS